MESIGINKNHKTIEKLLYVILRYIGTFIIGFVFSKAGIKTDISPFSLSFFAISPTVSLPPIPYFLGAFVGFISKDFSVYNFKYIIANTVMLAIILIFGSEKYYNRVYSPALPAVICFLIGFIFLFADTLSIYSVILLICEALLCGCVSYFIKFLLDAVKRKAKLEVKDIISLNITLLIVICALDNYYIFGISSSFIFTTLLIYLSCYFFDRKTALLFCAALCAVPAVLHPTEGHYFILLYIPAAVAILISKFEKKHIITSYYLSYITIFTVNITWGSFGTAIAPIVSAIIYTLIPKKMISDRLSEYIDVYKGVDVKKENYDELCKKYNEATLDLLKKMDNTDIKPILDTATENKLKRYLHTNRCKDVSITNYYNESGKQIIVIECKNGGMFSVSSLKKKISELCNSDFIVSEEKVDQNHIFCRFEQSDKYKIECFALYKAKNNEAICGDNISAFKSVGDDYNMILADGMGSGKEAYSKSFDTVTLLRKLLKSGVSGENAIETVNSSMEVFKDSVGFSTIDLCKISLYNGMGEFIKCGAYKSFLFRDSKIEIIPGGGFPAGLNEKISYIKKEIQFQNNDIIIMMSDGVASTDEKMQAILLMNNNENIEFLTRELIDCANRETPPELDDDMTILVAKVIKRSVE